MKSVRALLAALVTACGPLLGAAEILAANQGKLESVQGNTTVREGQEVALRFSLEEILGNSGRLYCDRNAGRNDPSSAGRPDRRRDRMAGRRNPAQMSDQDNDYSS